MIGNDPGTPRMHNLMRPTFSISIKALVLAALALATTSIGANGLRYTRLLSSDVVRALRTASSASGWEARQKSAVTLESLLMTKTVTIGLDFDAQDGDARRIDGMRSGLKVWQDALSDCPFREARDEEQPDVLVKFVKDIPDGGDLAGEIEAGRHISWGSKSRTYTLTATLLVRADADGRRLSKAEITEVVAHELGHLLGLDDDDRTTGLMGPFVPGKPRPHASDEEIQTVIDARDEMRSRIVALTTRR
jgi:hypothetical protein